MKLYSRRLSVFACLLTLFASLFSAPFAAAETTPRVLILPLTIHSEKDLGFLNKGIMDMLSSRINQAATVVRKNSLPKGKDAMGLARDLNADFVVIGSLTLFGESVSTDVALTAVKTGKAAVQFNQFSQNSSDALGHINQFAGQAGQYLTSLAGGAKVAAPVSSAPPTMVPQKTQPVAPARQVPAPAPAPVAKTKAPAVQQAKAATDAPLWTSNTFKDTITGLATGDVDGNGQPDIVSAHGHQIIVQQKIGERLQRKAVFDAGKRHKTVGVDVADINQNGRAEIFVTRLNAHKKLDSIVLEWNGKGLAPIADGQRWYFRTTTDPERGAVLMGQRRGTPSANDTGGLYENKHFLPGVFELSVEGNKYRVERRLPLPGEMTIYRFARGDLFHDDQIRTIAYSGEDKLRVYDPAGSSQWAGEESFGGTPLYLASPSATDKRTKDRAYLAQRFMVIDLDGDGKAEVVTVHNRDAAKGFVERFRKYTKGRMVAFRWNKVNMKEIWQGEEISGYISDFSLADLDGDGRLEAVYAMVASTGILQSKSSSIVVEQFGELSGN